MARLCPDWITVISSTCNFHRDDSKALKKYCFLPISVKWNSRTVFWGISLAADLPPSSVQTLGISFQILNSDGWALKCQGSPFCLASLRKEEHGVMIGEEDRFVVGPLQWLPLFRRDASFDLEKIVVYLF